MREHVETVTQVATKEAYQEKVYRRNTDALSGTALRLFRVLTIVAASLLACAAGAGVFVSRLYRDAPDWVLQARAQDCVSLAVGVPVLFVAGVWLGRSHRLQLVWLGALTKDDCIAFIIPSVEANAR